MQIKLRYLIALLVLIALAAVGLVLDQTLSPGAVLSTRDFCKLPATNLRKPVTAHLSGTVTYSDNILGLLVLQDSAGGVRLRQTNTSNFPPLGAHVQLSGSVVNGGLSPAVRVTDLKQTGTENLPAAKSISFSQARSGAYEFQRVSLQGVVRSVMIMERTGLLHVDISSPTGPVTARVHEYGNHDFRAFVDADVRAEGVLISSLDVYGHPANSTLWIPNIDSIHILTPAPAPRSLRISQIREILTEHATEQHRVRLQGTLRTVDGQLTVSDSSGQIPLTAMPPNTKEGEQVDTAGFLVPAGGVTYLADAVVIAAANDRAQPGKERLIESAQAIHELPGAVAQYGFPARLHGVVTFFDPRSQLLFMQDKTAGIFVSAQGRKLPPVASGNVVDVSGVTGAGGFAPVVLKPEIKVLSKGSLPAPAAVDEEQIFSGQYDSQFVELPGVVRKIRPNGVETVLTLNLGQHTFNAHVIGNTAVAANLLDASVRLRGVCGSITNGHRQLTGIQLFVPSWKEVKLEQTGPANSFNLATTPLTSVLQYSPNQNDDHRVHVRGTVILSDRLGPTWIADDTGSLMISDHSDAVLNPGDLVDAVGFPTKGALSPTLTAADLRRSGANHLPDPVSVVADEVSEGAYDNQYIAIQAKLAEVMVGTEETSLLLQSGNTSFYAHVKLGGGTLPAWEIGSILNVKGICAMDVDYITGYIRPRLFQVYVNSPAQVSLVEPAPILSRDFAVKVLSVAGLAIFLFVLWIVVLQRRVRHQTHTIKLKLHQEAALKEEAQRASEAKGQFLANMSHEIRTPLNGIIGFTELTLSTPLTADQKENLSTVRSSAVSLLQIVNDVLDFSKVEAGRMELNPQPFSVRSFAETAARSVRPHSPSGLVPIVVTVEEDVPYIVEGDETRLRQVVLNLLGNAAKFTPSGEIRFTIPTGHREGSRIELLFTVADTGIGIAPEARDKIFEAFQQADGSITRNYGGTGLGLAICKRIVSLMGGEISLESEKGTGTTVRFRCMLTLSEEANAPAPAVSVEAQEAPPMRILIAEDNPVNRRLIERVLRRKGHTVTLANNGEEAVELFGQGRFDLILMDVHMPEMDGLEATRRIRKLPNGAAIPILAFTASAMDSELQRYMEAGMTGFLTKPFQSQDLMNTLAMYAPSPGQPVGVA